MKNTTLIQLVGTLVAALVIVGVYVFCFIQLNTMQGNIAALSAEIDARSGEQANTSVRAVLAELEIHEAFIDARTVPEEDIVSFLETLEALGRSFGATVDVASVSNPDNGRITIALSITGSFDAVMRTVGSIEHSRYGTATKSLTLDALGEGSWSAAFTFIVTTPTP